MARQLLVLFLAILSCIGLNAQGSVLSPSASISLITVDPGEEVYAAFGHSAIRVSDPDMRLDVAFNYGTFNFNTPNFYGKFIAGETYYCLSVDNTAAMLLHYSMEGRSVREQVLNLSPDEKNRLWNALLSNARPENATYLYNFVFDNCATRPRDIIERSLEMQTLNYKEKQCDDTFRDLIADYVGEDSWNKFGIDMLIGSEADKVAPQRLRMFLPLEVESDFSIATKFNGEPIVSASRTLVPESDDFDRSPLVEPLWVMLFVLMVVGIVTILFPTYLKVLDVILFSFSGLLGCLLFYLSFCSLHPLVHDNFNLLWLSPLFLPYAVVICFRALCRLSLLFSAVLFLSVFASVVGFLFIPQQFNIAFLPLMLTLNIRLAGRIKELLRDK
ncbi:MAG: DUF4105 domain-containing protein [Paludibacteraceae bacterium]|nr:DUF4105 domain-containing protein [Paludibacteraceae bacterium]